MTKNDADLPKLKWTMQMRKHNFILHKFCTFELLFGTNRYLQLLFVVVHEVNAEKPVDSNYRQ